MSQYRVRQSSPLRSLEHSVKNDSAKLREKLANRRSILNQSDGRLRRPVTGVNGSSTSMYQKSTPQRLSTGKRSSNSFSHSNRTINNSRNTKDNNESRELRNVTSAYSKNNDIKTIREGAAFRSISRKRERKEAAEMKLKGLFSRSLNVSQSDDSGARSFFSAATGNTASTEATSDLYDSSSEDKGGPSPIGGYETDDKDSNHGSLDGHENEHSDENEHEIEHKDKHKIEHEQKREIVHEQEIEEKSYNVPTQIKEHFSQQEHIQIYDSFIMIKM
jgi:hypothetical protein